MELGAGLQPGLSYHIDIALLYFSVIWMLKYSLAGQLARFEHHTVEVYPWPIVMAMVMIMVMVVVMVTLPQHHQVKNAPAVPGFLPPPQPLHVVEDRDVLAKARLVSIIDKSFFIIGNLFLQGRVFDTQDVHPPCRRHFHTEIRMMKQSLENWFPLRTKYLQSEAWLANTLLPDFMQFYLNSLQQQAIPPDQNMKQLLTRN